MKDAVPTQAALDVAQGCGMSLATAKAILAFARAGEAEYLRRYLEVFVAFPLVPVDEGCPEK